MASLIKTLAFDCADALRLAQLWAAALGSNLNEDSTAERAFVEAPGWGGPNIWFNAVPEPKTAKNRNHLDLRAPPDLRAEVQRLNDLGAVVVHETFDLVGMQDPEGNEFCVV